MHLYFCAVVRNCMNALAVRSGRIPVFSVAIGLYNFLLDPIFGAFFICFQNFSETNCIWSIML